LNNLKQILFISYFFPPLGGPGVQRAQKFTKYLPQFGWQPIVITVKNIEYIAYDYSLLKEISNVEIHRTDSFDLMRLLYHFERIRNIRKKENKLYMTASDSLRKFSRKIFPIE